MAPEGEGEGEGEEGEGEEVAAAAAGNGGHMIPRNMEEGEEEGEAGKK